MSEPKSKPRKVFQVALFLVTLYMGIAITSYRFGHPEQTETQVLFNFFEALTWSW